MRYSLTEWEIFLVFFSFLARNGLKFLVSREKSKCEKNGNYSYTSPHSNLENVLIEKKSPKETDNKFIKYSHQTTIFH